MDFQSCETDAAGAALKAIQCAELMAQGKAVHPRAGDESFPEIFLQTVHAVQTLHGRMSVRSLRREARRHAVAQSDTLPALRHLYGLVS